MSSESNHPQLHFILLPLMAQGHSIPMIDMAKLFASKGIKITIITTPKNAIPISKSIEKSDNLNLIKLLILNFPSLEAGLPQDCESVDVITSHDLMLKFYKALSLFEKPVEKALMETHPRPHCLVADMFFPWANDVASKFGIPRLSFHGTSFFSHCADDFMSLYKPYLHVSSDSEPFTIPYLPPDHGDNQIKFTKMQLPGLYLEDFLPEFAAVLNRVGEADSKCYGTVVNSFYELERDYADCFRNVLGRKAWHIGPLSLQSNDVGNVQIRGRESSIDEHECLKWLNSKQPNSVVYICFGSMGKFSSNQLKEIANGIEASRQEFIWVVKKEQEDQEINDYEDWLPENLEGKGLIIRGWAPQVLILNHEAICGFMTHCGWNSILEGVTAGIPMISWPLYADQFYNERLVTQILKIAVPVKNQKGEENDGLIKREAIESAIKQVMVGGEAEEMRRRAREFSGLARKAVANDGSSYSDLNALIEDIASFGS